MGSQAVTVPVCGFRKFRPNASEGKAAFGTFVIFICLLSSGCGGGGGTGRRRRTAPECSVVVCDRPLDDCCWGVIDRFVLVRL